MQARNVIGTLALATLLRMDRCVDCDVIDSGWTMRWSVICCERLGAGRFSVYIGGKQQEEVDGWQIQLILKPLFLFVRVSDFHRFRG